MTTPKENPTGLIRVPLDLHSKIEKRAKRNFRSIPKEIEYMHDTIEKLEKQNDLSKPAVSTEGE